MSLIGEGFGVAERAGSAAPPARADGLIDPVTVGGMAPSAVARDSSVVCAAHDLVELLVELFLIEQLPAGGAVDLGAQFGDAVLVGVLHLRLARDQPGQNVVAEEQIVAVAADRRSQHGRRAITTIQNARGPNRACLPAWKRCHRPVTRCGGCRMGRHGRRAEQHCRR